MRFSDAWRELLKGNKIRLPEWEGYWAWEDGTIMMHCRDGVVLDIRETTDPEFTFSNIAEERWEIVPEQ